MGRWPLGMVFVPPQGMPDVDEAGFLPLGTSPHCAASRAREPNLDRATVLKAGERRFEADEARGSPEVRPGRIGTAPEPTDYGPARVPARGYADGRTTGHPRKFRCYQDPV